MIVIGVDAHKHTHTVAASSRATGRLLGELTVEAREIGLRAAAAVSRERHGDGERVWAIEDCRHVSGGLERFLLGAGETVVRVPPKMMAGERAARGPTGSPTRSTRWRSRARRCASPTCRARLAGPEREIALLVDYRADLVAEPTRRRAGCGGCCTTLTPTWRRPIAGCATRRVGHARAAAGAARADRAGPGLPRPRPAPARAQRADQAARARVRAVGRRARQRRCSRSPAAGWSPPPGCSPRSARSTASGPTRSWPSTPAPRP